MVYNHPPPTAKASAFSSHDDGAVPCRLTTEVAGWRHSCDLCDTSIFNVHLVATAPAPTELCVDCWAAAARGAIELPTPPPHKGSAARALRLADFSVRSQMQPELLVELSRKLHTALSGGATDGVVMPPPPPRMPAAVPISFGGVAVAPAPPKAAKASSRGGPSAAAANGGGDLEEETVDCPEIGVGWTKTSKRRGSSRGGADPRHRDHLWCSPDGRRFNSRVKVQRYLDSLAAAPAVKEEEEEEGSTWVQCERCEKWRELSGPPKLGGALGDAWFCEMNDDAARNSCDAPEQSWDDEEWTDDGSAAAAKAAPAPAPEKPAAARRRGGDTFGTKSSSGRKSGARAGVGGGESVGGGEGGGVGVGAAGGADAAAARCRGGGQRCRA